jgi:hypothetical protein
MDRAKFIGEIVTHWHKFELPIALPVRAQPENRQSDDADDSARHCR